MNAISCTSSSQISANDQIVLLGSCFSDSMYDLMMADKLNVASNHLGTIFHPLALFQIIERSLTSRSFLKEDYFKYDNYWFCYEQHSCMAERNLQEAVKKSNDQLDALKNALQNADHLVLTFGSAWGYFMDEKIVANCHQQPGDLFVKKLSDAQMIKKELGKVLLMLKKLNPDLNILLTVSPVRHLKDGVVENQWSKSILHVFCHEIVQEFNQVAYFPSYELVMDELRDHHYFKSDKVHLTLEAVDRVYEFVQEQLFSPALKERTKEWARLKKSLAHRSLRLYSSSNLKFKLKVIKELQSFAVKHKVNCDKELRELNLEVELIQLELNSVS